MVVIVIISTKLLRLGCVQPNTMLIPNPAFLKSVLPNGLLLLVGVAAPHGGAFFGYEAIGIDRS